MAGPRGWLLLVSTLPGQNGAARVSLWRSLKALGVANLRDGTYLLPERPELASAFRDIERDVVSSGGSAYVFQLNGDSEAQDRSLRELFDRSDEYAELARAAEELVATVADRTESDVRRAVRQLRRDIAAVDGIDYFGSPGRDRVQRLLRDLDAQVDRTFSPDEPSATHTAIERRTRREFRGRTWVTRRHLWVDRVASAWLIRRFIDNDARFLWLENPNSRPKDALGFDFDGADFTHVDDLTTFEVLVVAFELSNDPGLAKLGSVVHYLDVGGGVAPEAAGFEAILSGTRERSADDNELLLRMSPVLDALYDAFTTARASAT